MDVIKLRIFRRDYPGFRVGPKYNDRYTYNSKSEGNWRLRHRGGGHVYTVVETSYTATDQGAAARS